MQTSTDDEIIRELRQLVRLHQVCWSVSPENLVTDVATSRRVQVGFEIELGGIHVRPLHSPSPGCDECREVWRDLEQIARYILPEELRPSRYEISAFAPRIQCGDTTPAPSICSVTD